MKFRLWRSPRKTGISNGVVSNFTRFLSGSQIELFMQKFETLTLQQQVEKLEGQCRRWKTALRKAYGHWLFLGYERDELECLLGFKAATEKLLASNLRLRVAASEILSQLLGELRENSLSMSARGFCYGSFLGPLVNERTPEIDVDAFRARVDKLIRSENLSSVFGIELQALTNYPQRGKGCSFLLNAHALLWTDDTEFDVDEAQRRMRQSCRLVSELGAPTATLTPRTLNEGELEYAGRYMLKPPADGKFRARHDEIPNRWVLKPTDQVRPAMLLRLAEILSQLEFTDLVWSVNDETAIRTRWKQRLAERNKRQCARLKQPLERNFDTAGLWSGIRARPRNGSRLYEAPVFRGKLPKR